MNEQLSAIELCNAEVTGDSPRRSGSEAAVGVGVRVAAIRDHDGAIYSVPRPGRHHDVIRLMVEKGRPKPITGTQGFLLSDGRFVMRKAAGRVAIASGEIQALKWPPNLYSEDLW